MLFAEHARGSSKWAWRGRKVEGLVAGPKVRSDVAGLESLRVHVAAFDGKVEALRRSLEEGGDPNGRAVFEMYLPPLHLASIEGHVDCARLLLERGATIDADHLRRGGRHPTHLAAMFDHVDLLQLFFEAGASANARDRGGATLLTTAAAQGNEATVRLLLGTTGIEPHLRSGQETALHAACRNGHARIVKLLVNRELENRRGWKNFDEVVLILTMPLQKGPLYTGPAQLAKANGHVDCAAIVDVALRDCQTRTYAADNRASGNNGYKSRRATSLLHETQYVSIKPQNQPPPQRPPPPWPATKNDTGGFPDFKASYDPSMGCKAVYGKKCAMCEPTAKDASGLRLNTRHSTAQHHAWVKTAIANADTRRQKKKQLHNYYASPTSLSSTIMTTGENLQHNKQFQI